MKQVAIVVLGESLDSAQNFTLEMDDRIGELLRTACEDLQECIMAKCYVMATPVEVFRQTLTRGFPPAPDEFVEAEQRIMIAADQKSHAFLDELAESIKIEVEAGRFQGRQPQILRLSDALAAYLRRNKMHNVWLQDSPVMSAETDLVEHIQKAGVYPYRMDETTERHLHHLACGTMACICMQKVPKEQMREKVQTYQYAVHSLAKSVNVIIYESWARPLYSMWDQTQVPMLTLDATHIYMQEAINLAINDPPPRD